MSAALKLDPARTYTADERLAMLRALPVSDEPPTPEEDALFEEIESEVRAGVGGGVTTDEIIATIDQMRDDAAE
jgi:hypothetical protein